MVGRSHTTTQFTGKVRILLVTLVQFSLLFAQQVGANSRAGTEGLEVKGLIVVSTGLGDLFIPEAIGIVAIERQHLAIGHRSTQLRPARTGIEGQVESYLLGYLLQSHQVLTTSSVFVIKLSRYHRTAILPLQPLHLCEYLAIQQLGIVHEGRILFAHLTPFLKHPIRNAAVTNLTMTERT